MNQYRELFSQDLLRHIGYKDSQIDLIGRLLLLRENSDLVKSVDVEYGENTGFGLEIGPIHNPTIEVEVGLQRKLKNEDHEILMGRIIQALAKVGVNEQELGEYCEHSYALEREEEGVDVHFGLASQD